MKTRTLTLGLALFLACGLALSLARSTTAIAGDPPAGLQGAEREQWLTGRAAGHDYMYYRLIGELCGALTEKQKEAQWDSAHHAILRHSEKTRAQATFKAGASQGLKDAREEVSRQEHRLCTCENPDNFYNLSLVCSLE